MDVATLGIRVESNGVVVANDRLKGFQGEAAKSEASANRLSTSVRRLGASLLAGFAAGFSIRAIVSTLSDFEQSMSAVQAVMRPTAVDLESVRDKVKELGGTTEFTASQVADGFKFMGLAGWDAAQSIEAMPAVLNLATAASMDLARAADISSNIMSAFGLQASEASTVADTLAVANANANTSVEQLGDGMKYAGPIAQALGISVGDTAAAIGALSDAGIQGSMAGTSLRRIMSSLANATPTATRALAGMGLTLADLNPATNDLVDIVDRLAEAGLSAEAAFTIFGDRGAPAILALIENNAKLRELTGLLDDASGAASEMAGVMRDNLWGDIKNVQAAVESLIIAMGESGLTNVIRTSLQGVTEVIRAIASNFERLALYATGFATFMAGPYVAAMVASAAATASLSGALTFLRAAIARTGIGLLVLLVTDVVYRIYDATIGVRDFGEAIEETANTGRSFFETLQVGAEAIVSTFDWAASSVAMVFIGAFATIQDAFTGLMNLIMDGLSAIPGVDVTGWKGDATAGTQAFNRARDETRTAYQAMTTNWRRLFQGEWMDRDLGGNDIVAQWERFNKAGGAALTDLTDKSDALAGAIDGVGGSLTAANDNLKEMENIGQRVIGRLSNAFTDLFEAAIIGGKDFGEIIRSLLLDLGRMFANAGFQALLGGFGSMGGGGGLLGGMIIPGILHSGGVAGVDGYGHSRALPASIWAGAERYHTGGIAGLKANEVPAILERGEIVLPANSNIAPQRVQIDVSVSVDESGNIVPLVRQVSGQEADVRIVQAAPAIVGAAVGQSNKSAPAAVASYQRQRAGGDWRNM